jgi:hypothetical protein
MRWCHSTLLRVSSSTLHKMMEDQELNRLFLSKMTECKARMNMIEMPRFAGLTQKTFTELRTETVEIA